MELSEKQKILFAKIQQLSNDKKFKIFIISQTESLNINMMSKRVKIAYNKCSNYCTDLEKIGLIRKEKRDKSKILISNINLDNIYRVFQI